MTLASGRGLEGGRAVLSPAGQPQAASAPEEEGPREFGLLLTLPADHRPLTRQLQRRCCQGLVLSSTTAFALPPLLPLLSQATCVLCLLTCRNKPPLGTCHHSWCSLHLLTSAPTPQPPAPAPPMAGPRIQGVFKGATTDIDRRHGDPDLGGLSSGEKVGRQGRAGAPDTQWFRVRTALAREAITVVHSALPTPDPLPPAPAVSTGHPDQERALRR